MRAVPRLLGPDDLAYVPGPPEFVALTAATLGNAITDSDGFDASLLSTASAVNDDLTAAATLDQHLVDASFVKGEFAAANHDQVVSDHKALVSTAGAQLDKFNLWQGAVTVPSTGEGGTGTGTGSTGPGGGAGGGGGDPQGGGGGPDPCESYVAIGVHCLLE